MADDHFEIRLDIMGGKPVIRGTRVPVETIWRKLIAGMSPEAIVADHPRLTREDVLAIQVLMEAQDASVYRLTDEQVAEVQRRRADPNAKRLTLDEFNERLSRLIGE